MLVVRSLKASVMRRSRNRKLEHFYSLCDRDAKVLDVGVTSNEHNTQVNLFLNEFRFSASQYTGLAVESMDEIRKSHLGKRFVEYPGGEFPFNDNEFDWIFSNAVIEHVGGEGKQLKFINEMLRVSKNVFFTTPNKYFPVEAHTNTLFRHWFSRSFYNWCKKNSTYWNEDNLVLLGYNDIERLMDRSCTMKYEIIVNSMLYYPMTFTIVCSK